MPQPEFPVNLGEIALQTDGTSDYRPRQETHRGNLPNSAPGHERPQPLVVPDTFGQYLED